MVRETYCSTTFILVLVWRWMRLREGHPALGWFTLHSTLAPEIKKLVRVNKDPPNDEPKLVSLSSRNNSVQQVPHENTLEISVSSIRAGGRNANVSSIGNRRCAVEQDENNSLKSTWALGSLTARLRLPQTNRDS